MSWFAEILHPVFPDFLIFICITFFYPETLFGIFSKESISARSCQVSFASSSSISEMAKPACISTKSPSFAPGKSVVFARQRLPIASTTALSFCNSTILAGIAKHIVRRSWLVSCGSYFCFLQPKRIQVIVILIILPGGLVGNAVASLEQNGVKNDWQKNTSNLSL